MQASMGIVMDQPDPVTGKIRVPVTLAAGAMAALDDYRQDKRLPSRAAALRELVRRGLGAYGLLDGQPKQR
jgi:hypothetical protein